MVVVVGAETLVLVLLALLVAGLLRSHARILQALHSLGVDWEQLGHGGHAANGRATEPDVPVALRLPKLALRADRGDAYIHKSDDADSGRAFNVTGIAPGGEAVSVAVLGSRVDTVLAFLSTGCGTCANFWQAFRAGAADALPDRTRLVIVTRGPGEESPARLRDLAPPDVPVILSTEAWDDYGVLGSPYFVYVHGPEAVVAGEGSAATWAEVTALFREALDNAPARRSGDGHDRSAARNRRRSSSKARADQEREARTDRALAAAGILPGDPRLYPPTVTAPPADER